VTFNSLSFQRKLESSDFGLLCFVPVFHRRSNNVVGTMPENLRILLVNAINPNVEVEARYPNLGLGYLAASVRKALPELPVLFRVADRDVQGALSRFRPHIVGVSSVSQNFDIAKAYADLAARTGAAVVMGGVHISALPALLPASASAACLGESEDTFVDVIKAYLGGGLTPDTLAGVAGVAYREGEAVRLTGPRPPRLELDTIPMPARDLFRVASHTYMFTSRGCPFKCAFCSSSRYWGRLRLFSAGYVVDEVGMLARDHGVDMISFYDDLFVASVKRVEEVVRLLEAGGLIGKVRFTCSCRANVVNPELAKLLRRMGVVSVGMGLESGDEETLRYLKGGNISVAHNHAAVDMLKAEGLAVNASFVIGSPDEPREAVMRTYEFIKKSRLDLFDVYLLTPFPGTPVWGDAKGRGLVTDDMPDWSVLDVNVYRAPDKAVIMSKTMGRDEVVSLYRKFRRMRLWRNLIKSVNHPLMRDLPKMAVRALVERLSGVFGRRA